MLAKKLLWTGVLVLSYAIVATVGDFTLNVLIRHDLGGFTPAGTILLAMVIGAPTTYYLISQRMDLRRAIAERDQTDANLQRKSEELAVSEARYRLLADTSPDVIIRYDSLGRAEYISPAARAYGWDPQDLSGVGAARAEQADHPSPHQPFLTALASGAAVREGEETVWRAATPRGDTVYFEGRSSPIRSPDGAFLGVVAVLRDVTESRMAAAALERSEQKLRGAFEMAPLGIVLTDMNGRCVEYNAAFLDICGYADDELKALDRRTLIPPEHDEIDAARSASLKGTGRYGPFETEYRRKDGSRAPVRLNEMVIESADGEKLIWSIVEDIAEQRRTEKVLIEARNAAEAATVAKSEFLANMSHEIRTPLTGILGFTGLLHDQKDLTPAAKQYIDRIATSGQALLAVVNDILDFSKLDADRIELDPHPFNPQALVAETTQLVSAEAARKGLVLEQRLIGPVPDAVHADSSRIRQVLLNLLSNAVKFTDKGGVTVTTSFSQENGGRLRISVADTGVGIPADRQSHLFQRFSQVDGSITRQYGGTGLGLAISKRLTELMGGAISVESHEGVGSTFTFTVEAPPAKLEPPPPQAMDAFATVSARILVVDDLAVNRELVRAMLSSLGYDLFDAASGAEAVASAMADAFDLILMDLQMPGMDGLAATRVIRQSCELNRTTPILALSANVLPEHRLACHDAGMDDHISKPISPQELLSKISFWTAGEAPDGAAHDAAA